jgi:hypothetical protein
MLNLKSLVVALALITMPFVGNASEKKHQPNADQAQTSQGAVKVAPASAKPSTNPGAPVKAEDAEEEGHDSNHNQKDPKAKM